MILTDWQKEEVRKECREEVAIARYLQPSQVPLFHINQFGYIFIYDIFSNMIYFHIWYIFIWIYLQPSEVPLFPINPHHSDIFIFCSFSIFIKLFWIFSQAPWEKSQIWGKVSRDKCFQLKTHLYWLNSLLLIWESLAHRKHVDLLWPLALVLASTRGQWHFVLVVCWCV